MNPNWLLIVDIFKANLPLTESRLDQFSRPHALSLVKPQLCLLGDFHMLPREGRLNDMYVTVFH